MKRKVRDIKIDGTALSGLEFKKALDKALSEHDFDIAIKPPVPVKVNIIWRILDVLHLVLIASLVALLFSKLY